MLVRTLTALCLVAVLNQSMFASEASDAYEVGNAYLKDRHYQQALGYFERAVRSKPDFVDAYIGRGRAFMRLRKYVMAARSFSKALDLEPDSAKARSERGWALTSLNEFDDAASDFTKAIALDPENPQNYVGRASAYKGMNKLDLAIQDYDKALGLNPRGKKLIEKSRAFAYLKAGNLDKACSLYEELFKTYPDNVFAQIDKINILYRLREYDRVVELSTGLIDTRPGHAWFFRCARAAAYGKQGKTAMALDDLKAAIASPEKARAEQLATRGNTYFELGRYELAAEDYTAAIKRRPEFKKAYIGRSRAYLADGRPEKAVDDCNRALELEWKDKGLLDAKIYKTRAAARLKLGNPDRALGDLDLSIKLYAWDPEVYALRARVYRLKGDSGLAEKDMKKAGQLGWSGSRTADRN